MAYSHSKYEVVMQPVMAISASGAATTVAGARMDATGVVANWAPGFVPHIIKGAAVRTSATVNHANAVHVSVRADVSVPGTPTELFKIVLPTAGTIHKAVYKRPTYQIEVKPGMVVEANVTAAATRADGTIVLYVEPRWEEPANVTSMLQTT